MVAQDILSDGIEAFQHHQLERAQTKFAKAVIANPNSEDAWLWLARVIADRDHRLYCYQRVLEINPRNSEAATAYQYVPVSARPPSVQRALAMNSAQSTRSNRPAPIVAPRRSAQTSGPIPPPNRRGLAPGYLLLNTLLLFVFLSLYIAVQWTNITTQVQNVALTPVKAVTAVIFPSVTPVRPPQTQTPAAPSPRPQTNGNRPTDALFARAQQDLDSKNSQGVLDLLLPNLGKLTERDDLSDAYYFLGRAEVDLEDYSAAAGYFKKLYAIDPSVEYLFMLAVSHDMAGNLNAALEEYTALAAWNGTDAPLYNGLAIRRIADLKRVMAQAPAVAR
jgi:tetratricopeptide (TPR) repeat protein